MEIAIARLWTGAGLDELNRQYLEAWVKLCDAVLQKVFPDEPGIAIPA